MTTIKPIHLVLKNANALTDAPLEISLEEQFRPIAAEIVRLASNAPQSFVASVNVVSEFLEAANLLDGSYGHDSPLPIDDADTAADEALRALADITAAVPRYLPTAETEKCLAQLDNIVIGIGLWAMRHSLDIFTPEPIVNALATRANGATSTQETAAAFAMMQGFVAHLAPRLSADLERSNPERPWRLLNVNFAITAIRTGDAAMMRHAFDQINNALPDERAGFYAEAYSLASQPGFPLETRSLIEHEHRRFAYTH